MPKIFKKKINKWLAFLIIFIVAFSATVAVTAKAAGVLSFGGIIYKYTPLCLPPPACTSMCLMCGCGSWGEVAFVPFGGDINYICPPLGYQPLQGSFVPGFQILGWGFSPYFLGQVGTSP